MTTGVQAVAATLIAAAALPSLGVAQVKGENPIKTTTCELIENPPRYNNTIVAVRGRIEIAFENFTLSTSECVGRKIDVLWLEYGKGPKKQPTTWCCGDMVPRDQLVVAQDSEFRKFHKYLTAEKQVKGCYDCYLYQVTATLTGRFDAVNTEPCPGDAKGRCCPTGGFGHLGRACARLVIQSVSDVDAKPIDRSGYGKRR